MAEHGLFASPHATKRRRDTSDGLGQEAAERRPKRIIVIDDDDAPTSFQGDGSQGNPIMFTNWITGNIITTPSSHESIMISDSEEEHGVEDGPNEGHEHASSSRNSSIGRPYGSSFKPRISQHTSSPEMSVSRDLDNVTAHSPLGSTSRNRDLSLEEKYAYLDQLEELSNSDVDEASVNIHDDGDDDDDDDDDDCLIIYEEVKEPDLRIGPWTFSIKAEDDEEMLPELLLSQLSRVSTEPETPSSSQQSLDIGAAAGSSDRFNSSISSNTSALTLPYSDDPQNKTTSAMLCKGGSGIDEDTSIIIRKRLFWETHWALQAETLKRQWETHLLFIEGRRTNGCWLYKGPKLRNSRDVLSISVTFRCNGRSQKLTINLSLIGRLLAGHMTKQEKEGLIEHRWHASHLCGNWTCLNPIHINPEPGSINSSRNGCLPHKESPCDHTPPCMKHLKVRLSALRPFPGPTKADEARERIQHRGRNAYHFDGDEYDEFDEFN
jgi:hypothetical protein